MHPRNDQEFEKKFTVATKSGLSETISSISSLFTEIMLLGGKNTQKMMVHEFCFQIRKDIDICLLELTEDIIETGRLNSVLLRTICLPKTESLPGSSQGSTHRLSALRSVTVDIFRFLLVLVRWPRMDPWAKLFYLWLEQRIKSY